ncbi:CLUMA_CG004141, isoform A [Clunio marinus]|uniref:CLUMA_CG004141, isoform A n=1 Tax=Clunio marinus TaxID=568069 RepID=A0A1J1HR18_9DIPT|nr:CLUMA_CG004141, isoform A [Clunio marinus]
MRKIFLIFLVAFVYNVKAWPHVRRSSPMEILLPKKIHTLSECMQVTSEDGVFTYRKVLRKSSRFSDGLHFMEVEPNESHVCGVYFITDPDKVVEIEIDFMDVSCELGGLLGFVDGWELNGEYFPGIHDHELNLENRIDEFCDKPFAYKKKINRKKKFISHQNAAVFQYKIPIQGAFAITVRYLHNPKPCNIMAEGVAPYYLLQNYGTSRNCTVTATFPAVVSIEGISVGGNEADVNYDCDQPNAFDKVIVGGSSGLDSHHLTKATTICGKSQIKGPEQAIFCGVTSIRLDSSGKYNNKVIVALRPADETDISLATAVCDL